MVTKLGTNLRPNLPYLFNGLIEVNALMRHFLLSQSSASTILATRHHQFN